MTYARQSSHPPKQAVTVLVADRSRARLFQSNGQADALVETESLTHTQSRLRNRELVSDAPGLTVGAGYPQGAPTEAASPHDREAETFARQIAARLERLRTDHALGRLYLVAEPRFMGLLHAALNAETRKQVVGEVQRRLTGHALSRLRAALPTAL